MHARFYGEDITHDLYLNFIVAIKTVMAASLKKKIYSAIYFCFLWMLADQSFPTLVSQDKQW